MTGATVLETRAATYELEIEIDATPERVWEALVDETNAWWLPDFHMVGAGSIVTFDTNAGGHLIERHANGASLLWYTVQFCQPADHVIHLAGHVAPDWGGPATTMLKMRVKARGDGSVLTVTDAHFGHVDDETLDSLESGWKQLFTDGLKAHIER